MYVGGLLTVVRGFKSRTCRFFLSSQKSALVKDGCFVMYINIILLRVSERITCMCFGYMHTKTFQKRCIFLNVSQSESESYISNYPRTVTFKHVNGN